LTKSLIYAQRILAAFEEC